MTNIPNFVRDRLKAQPSASDHPDANVLTAFSEHVLEEPERVHVLAHLAQCADCRDVLAQALPPVEVQAAAPSPALSTSWFRAPVLRWASLAACIVVVAAAALLLQNKPPAAMHSEADVVLPAAPQSPKLKTEITVRADKTGSDLAEAKTAQPAGSEIGTPAANKVARRIKPRAEERELQKDVAVSGQFNNAPVPAPHAYDAVGQPRPAPASTIGLSRDTAAFAAAKESPAAGANIAGNVATNGERSANLRAAGRMVAAHAQPAAPNAAPPAADETAEVTAQAVGVTQNGPAPASPGKAKAGSVAQLQSAEAAAAPLAKKQLANTDTKISVLAAGARWALSSQGQLQRSTDNGNTWEPVPVVENVTFRALSAFGNNIWVGGLAGMLYHSSDAGTHWTQVRPVANGVALTGDIVSLRFVDSEHGQLATSTSETWVTTDAGRSWSRNN